MCVVPYNPFGENFCSWYNQPSQFVTFKRQSQRRASNSICFMSASSDKKGENFTHDSTAQPAEPLNTNNENDFDFSKNAPPTQPKDPLMEQEQPKRPPSSEQTYADHTQSQLLRTSIDMTCAEILPRNRSQIVKSPYMPPQGEAWKQGIFPKEAPKIIAIDPFDILIQLRSEPGWFYRDILQEATDYNARLLPPEHYTQAFQKAQKQVQVQFPCFGVRDGITSKNWWMKVAKLTYQYADITEPRLREELDEWLFEDVFDVLFHDVFMTEEAWEIRPGAVEALCYLKKWRDEEDGPTALCVLCNFDERMHAILDELDLLDAFDFVLTSREIGTQLPERSAFQVAMSRVGLTDPKQCMHVSADFWNCVVGASKAGWHAVYLPETGEQDIAVGTDPELVFTMLGDLFGVLHIWERQPENRLIDTTRPALENGVFGFHEKDWDESDKVYKDKPYFLPPNDRSKSWDGPERF